MSTARIAFSIARRDVSLELSGREASITVLPFVAALMMLAGLGLGGQGPVLSAAAPGLVWLVVLVSAIPLARGVAAAERADGCWDLLRALASPTALLAGKLAALWLWLLIAWAVASMLAVALLGAAWRPEAAVAGVLGTFGVAVTTVVLGVLLPHGARRPGLIAVLLVPGAVPVLIAGTHLAAPATSGLPWALLLASYDAISLITAYAVFPALLEE
ncbi:MAG: hypothetical protein GEU97_14935 [Actinophytocola sp.]|nr:hypothetical protein [Actinophytocola sp.]